jgi:drug/metabolite transporter (DMT)-like permease
MVSQAAGLVAISLVAIATGDWRASLGYLPWAVGAGLAGATGLLMYYRALAVGTMGVISPIAALSVVIPVAVGLANGHWPSAAVGAGIVLALLGVVAASGPERSRGRSLHPVLLAAASAVCFGVTLLFIARGAAHSPVMTMVGMRVASVLPLAAIVLGVRRQPGAAVAASGSARRWMLVVVAGLFDVSANLVFALASTAGTLPVVSILGSLYPAVTVLLARVVHGERLGRMQQCGVVIALLGVALIAGWS